MRVLLNVAVLVALINQEAQIWGFVPSNLHRTSSIKSDVLFGVVHKQAQRKPSSTTSLFSDYLSNLSPPAATDSTKSAPVKVPPASYSISTSPTGPASSPVTTLTIHLGHSNHPEPLVFQTGKIARQASGSLTLTRGSSVLLATAARDSSPKPDLNFLPLSVEYQERFSSAGTTSGSFNRRDGRPAEHEILTCRLIDRPIRPMVDAGWRYETQLLTWLLSYDGERDCKALGICASAAALWLSDVPLKKPIAAAEVGYVDGELVLNPTLEEMGRSRLQLTVAGTKEAVLMIEGVGDFLPEELMVEAVEFGHGAIKTICEGLEEFGKVAGKEKCTDYKMGDEAEELQAEVDRLFGDKVEELWKTEGDKNTLSSAMSVLSKEINEAFAETYPDKKDEVSTAKKDLLCRKMFERAKATGLRCDGRKLDEVRKIDIETGFLPMVHGSALFTRGETQTIATATLGDSGMKQKIDTVDGLTKKRFYLQYTFPPSCVGETGRTGAPGRREVGHGMLAERAIAATLPSEEEFPYSIRIESLITESNGSSSMASVCGGSLALMQAGVPVKSPVAGIAMGLLLGDKSAISDENAVILSDILGTEDALGTMDFKVAGNREGISTFQLDIKCEGLTIDTMKRALEQAKQGRLHILDEMDKSINALSGDLPPTVPRISSFKIPEDNIGKVIGPGGKQIRAIIEDFELSNMDVGEDGSIQLSSFDTEKMNAAEAFVKELIKGGGGGKGGRDGGRGGRDGGRPKFAGPEPEIGTNYKGKITGIHDFGVFVEIIAGPEDGSTPGLEGLCHVSELHTDRVRNCEGFVNSMGVEELEVKYIGKNAKGKFQLSRKQFLEERKSGGKKNPPQAAKAPTAGDDMPQVEVDVITQAIEGLKDL